ncbi:extracellular solute-binding protein [Paenibacillus alginolyticus]|uniref:Extracellular solute-binding protein n=1 Tax=Paenibacillus alginolyticus TaxID=59839 RepID=A0ABT4GH51_9BACL|nr:extracellular solute-binding protein [Paenibacillus alginolyticus]MCY9665964.1 extracellular solute-binding protein [Paenibacillus alginolyticus]MCY9695522.1 extracellular solute-binding protein [Paenibacillus alginolyticus]MEC0147288.1 extracellular solute-binding protein [Paenibacillus alginolyticus]
MPRGYEIKGRKKNEKKEYCFTLNTSVVTLLVAGCSSDKPKDTIASASPTSAPPVSAAPTANYGDTGGIKLPIVDKPTTLSWMLVSDNPNLGDSLVVKEIEKRTGIKLDIQAYSSGTYKDKLKVIVASGKLPDIFHGQTLAELNKMGGQGVLEPISQHLKDLPNFKKLYVDDKENNWVMKSWSDDKNNMYAWPLYGLQRDVNHGFLYRKDIFDKAGIKEWSNTEEFYQALKN